MNSDQGFTVVLIDKSSPLTEEKINQLEKLLDIVDPDEVKDLLANIIFAYQVTGDDPDIHLSREKLDKLHVLYRFLEGL